SATFMRNTPCVEGCCGPIDTSINSPSSFEVIAFGSSSVCTVAVILSSRFTDHDPHFRQRVAPPRRLIAAEGRNAVLLSPAHRRAESVRIRNRLVHGNPSALGNL